MDLSIHKIGVFFRGCSIQNMNAIVETVHYFLYAPGFTVLCIVIDFCAPHLSYCYEHNIW